MIAASISLKCNSRLCNYTTLQGKGYRTKCGHVFCEDCAMKAFSNSNFCTVCNFELHEGQVCEFLIGISTGPISRYMYQSAFQSNDWGDTLNNVRTILKSTLDLVVWTLHQLHFEAAKNTERVNILHNQNEQQRQNAMNVALHLKSSTMAAEHRIRELQQQLKDYDINTGALQEALNEKSQKCDAWEKAYNLIRTRVSNNIDEKDDVNVLDSAERLIRTNKNSNSSTAAINTVNKSGFITPPRIQSQQQQQQQQQQYYPTLRPLTTTSSPDTETNPSRVVRRRTETTTVRYAEGLNANDQQVNNNLNLDEDFVPKLGNFVSRGDADNSDQMRMNAFKFSVHNAASINSNDRTQQQRSQFFVAADNRVPAKSSFFSHRKQV